MKTDQGTLQIALAISGGGYRAASFALGTINYLDHLSVNRRTMLEHVSVLSTVSGGTITGARYASGVVKGERMLEIYTSLYRFFTDNNLIEEGLEKLTAKKESWPDTKVKSLINAFSLIYHEKLFEGALFGEILKDNDDFHLKHISFNATEFANALQFRFQKSEEIPDTDPNDPDRGADRQLLF